MARKTTRAAREAIEAAASVFSAAGWAWRSDFGGKHALIVVSPPQHEPIRFPVCGTPRGGVDSAVNIALWNARKLVRQLTQK